MGAGTVIGPISISMSRGLLYATEKSRLAFFKPHSVVASFSSSASVESNSRKLILYSKPGCCLCDGLKEKLHAAFSLSSPDSLQDLHLEVRDITSKVEWEQAYQYEIPVLARVLPDGSEEILPRLSPRLGVELIQKKLASALRQ